MSFTRTVAPSVANTPRIGVLYFAAVTDVNGRPLIPGRLAYGVRVNTIDHPARVWTTYPGALADFHLILRARALEEYPEYPDLFVTSVMIDPSRDGWIYA